MQRSWTIRTANIIVKTVTYTLIITHSVTANYSVINAAMLGTDTLATKEEGRERTDDPGTERRHCRKAVRLGHSEMKASLSSNGVCLLAGNLIL